MPDYDQCNKAEQNEMTYYRIQEEQLKMAYTLQLNLLCERRLLGFLENLKRWQTEKRQRA